VVFNGGLPGWRLGRRCVLWPAVAGVPLASARLVDTYVKSIRGKLGDARDLIETVRGVGYRFDATGREAPLPRRPT
jgi:DNA-binding response OmpR family regulator